MQVDSKLRSDNFVVGSANRLAVAAVHARRRLQSAVRLQRLYEALAAYLRATKVNLELCGDIYLRLGNIRLRRQEREEAIRCWERALELVPDDAIVPTNLEPVRRVC